MLAVTFFLSFTVIPIFTHAETMDDPAPIILPELPNGKKVLFDNTHGQTAGQADWVIDGAFSDFAEAIAANGYEVVEFRKNSPLTVEDLEPYDVFVIPEANIPFKKVEQEFTPGMYELTVTAKDKKGNITERTFSMEATLILSELDELVVFGEHFNYLDKKMEKRLLKKVKDVQKAKHASARQGKWNALLNQIKAQLGKKIKAEYIHYWNKPVDI